MGDVEKGKTSFVQKVPSATLWERGANTRLNRISRVCLGARWVRLRDTNKNKGILWGEDALMEYLENPKKVHP